MIVQIVRFNSGLTEKEVYKMYEERASQYRVLGGLRQKYYLKYPTGEYGAVYVWESEDALNDFRQSELGRTISTAYKVQGPSDARTAEVVMTLHPE